MQLLKDRTNEALETAVCSLMSSQYLIECMDKLSATQFKDKKLRSAALAFNNHLLRHTNTTCWRYSQGDLNNAWKQVEDSMALLHNLYIICGEIHFLTEEGVSLFSNELKDLLEKYGIGKNIEIDQDGFFQNRKIIK